MKHAKGMRDVYVQQAVTFQRDQETKNFLVAQAIYKEEFNIVALSALGQKLFSLQSKAGELKVSQHVDGGNTFVPTDFLSIMQWVYWPRAQLNTIFSGGFQEHREQIMEAGKVVYVRTLYYRKQPVVTLHSNDPEISWESELLLKFPKRATAIDIRPVEVKTGREPGNE